MSHEKIFAQSQSLHNDTLYEMLNESVGNVLKNSYAANDHLSIISHIHIASFLNPTLEFDLVKIRKKHGLESDQPITSIILQQGCAGLLFALQLADKLLKKQNEKRNHVLITAENNMLLHAHQRIFRNATIKNIDEWLWSAIFGEAVGSMVVGKNVSDCSMTTPCFGIKKFNFNVVNDNWRVACLYSEEKSYHEVIVKAREVRETYLAAIKANTTLVLEYFDGVDNVNKLCLHESNPKLLENVRASLNIPKDLVPTLSAKVGTLACVSAFTLLHECARHADLNLGNNQNIGMCLIGEACGRITAGHMCLEAIRL